MPLARIIVTDLQRKSLHARDIRDMNSHIFLGSGHFVPAYFANGHACPGLAREGKAFVKLVIREETREGEPRQAWQQAPLQAKQNRTSSKEKATIMSDASSQLVCQGLTLGDCAQDLQCPDL